MKTSQTPNLSRLANSWPSPFVARQELEKFSGGILNPKTIANLDSQKKGPAGRIRIGRKIAYPVSSLISWMENRAEVVK